MRPVSSLLTVVITTSPIPSSPSADLILSVLESFRRHCPDLAATRVIVVFDTWDRVTTSKPRLKSGSASPKIADNYRVYKDNVKSLILCNYSSGQSGLESLQQATKATAEFGSDYGESNAVELAITQTEDKCATFIEPAARLGFGLAVRSAVRLVETPYVWVQQHDWALVADIPLKPLLDVMQHSEVDQSSAPSPPAPIKYVSFPSVRMIRYADSDAVIGYPALRSMTAELKQEFISPSQPAVKVPLTPLFFWFDKPHLVSTAHYLSRVFPTRLAMRRGEFIEDKIGQRARTQMKEGLWHKWACWLYYPDEGRQLCLRHLMGRTWKGADEELLQKQNRLTLEEVADG